MTTDSADVVLADEHWRVTVAPSFGFLIRDALDLGSGAPMLWRQPAQAAPPLPLSLPPGGPESIETFWEVFAGGWFPMFPTAGFTGELDGAQTLFHGELNRLPWQVLDRGPAWIEAGLRTLRAPFAVIRRVSLEGGEMRVETEVSNAGQTPASFTYGEHPCFLHATFAGGKLELDAAEAWVPDPPFDPERVKRRRSGRTAAARREVLRLGRSALEPRGGVSAGRQAEPWLPHPAISPPRMGSVAPLM